MIREMTISLDKKDKSEGITKKILQPKVMEEHVAELFAKIYDADAVMNEPTSKIYQVI